MVQCFPRLRLFCLYPLHLSPNISVKKKDVFCIILSLTSSITLAKSAFVIVEKVRLNPSVCGWRCSKDLIFPNAEKIFQSIDTVVVVSRDPGSLREIIRVGKRVHTLLATGKGISVKL